jgi:hypothetical protein
MVTDLDVYRTAQLLVRQHGLDAPLHASLQHDALLEQGDLEGRAVWKRVLTTIDALLLGRPPVGTVLQQRRDHWHVWPAQIILRRQFATSLLDENPTAIADFSAAIVPSKGIGVSGANANPGFRRLG